MFVALSLFAFSFIVYISGVSASVYGGDSGDIILASWFGGVAHPPGYPLNTMIGWIFTHLPFEATIAFKANLTAAFLQALGIALLYLLLKKLTSNVYASLLGAAALAVNPLYWLYSHVYEVFQLNIVLLAVAVYYLICWTENYKKNKSKSWRDFYIFSFFWGLAVFHHHTSALLGPAFLYVVLNVSKNAVFKNLALVKAGLFFLFGIAPYIFILFAAARETPINWGNAQNLQNFVRLITRADYGTFTAASFLTSSTLEQKVLQLINYFLFFKSDFSILGILLISLGFIYAYFKNRLMFWFVLLAVLFSGPFFIVYAGFPIATDFYTGLWERFLLTSYYFVAIFAGFGFLFIIQKILLPISKRLKIFGFGQNFKLLILVLILFTYPFAMYFVNQPKADLSKFQLGNWLAYDILASAEPNALILLIGDTVLFNTQYVYYSDSLYRDRKIIKVGSLALLEYRQQVVKEYPDLIYPDSFLNEKSTGNIDFVGLLISSNIEKSPIYTRDHEPPVEGYNWVSIGLLKKLEKKDVEISAENLKGINDNKFANFKYRNFSENLGYSQYLTTHLKEHYYLSIKDLIIDFLKLNDNESALNYAQRAEKLLPNKKESYIFQGNIYFGLKNCDKSRANFESVLGIDKRDWRAYEALSNVYRECYFDSLKAEEFSKKADEFKPKSNIDLDTF